MTDTYQTSNIETRDGARLRARERAFDLAREVQTPRSDLDEDINRLIFEAETKGWSDVVRISLYAQAAGAFFESNARVRSAIDRLIDRADADNAPVMQALGLAMRSAIRFVDPGRSAAGAEDDLVRATVILETSTGPADERIIAHTACAIAYSDRSLWELAHEHFTRAYEEVKDRELPDAKVASVFFNLAALQVGWACGLRQLSDTAGIRERWRDGADAITAAAAIEMHESWQIEMEAIGLLLAALAGNDVARDARARISVLRAEKADDRVPTGLLSLARAVSDVDAGRSSRADIEALLGEESGIAEDPYTRELALFLAAEVEAASGSPAGLRCAKDQFAKRWAARLTALDAMRSRLQAERLRGKHAALSRQVRLDDLTGLANRRGLERYLSGLRRAGESTVAVLMVDVDDFKKVNDQYGHAIGDLALIAIARAIDNAIRPGDLAVRLGGDEFAAILAGADLSVGTERAKAIVAGIESQPLSEAAPDLKLRVSIGVTAGHPAQIGNLTTEADARLYLAKGAERGRGLPAPAPKGLRDSQAPRDSGSREAGSHDAGSQAPPQAPAAPWRRWRRSTARTPHDQTVWDRTGRIAWTPLTL